YSISVRLSSVVLLLVIAFSTAWPAFAYSLPETDETRRTFAFALTYLIVVCSWLALALAMLGPWLVRLLATPPFYPGARSVPALGCALTAYAGYVVVAIGMGRTGKTGFNWIATGAAAVVNTLLNLLLIPPLGAVGAAFATLGGYVCLFGTMAWYTQRIYP